MKHPKLKSMLLTLTLLLVATCTIVPVISQESMIPDSLLIHMYLDKDAEFYALEAGEIDIVDSPLTKDWIDRWVANPDIQMRDYREMSWHELSINHQVWPTGWRNYYTHPPGTLQPYDPAVQRHVDARHFRTALAYLTDKQTYISSVLGGYGISTEASKPAGVGWISPNLVTWPYNPAVAANELTTGGFIDYDYDGTLEYDEDRNPLNGFEEVPALEVYGRLDDPFMVNSSDLLVAELTSVGIPVNYHKELAWPCYLAVMFGAPPGVNLPANWPDVTHWLPWVDTNADGSPEWLEGTHRFHLYTARHVLEAPRQEQYYDLYVEAMATEGNMLSSMNYGGFYVGDGVWGTSDDAYDYEYWASLAKFGATESEVKIGVFKCQELAQELWPSIPWFSALGIKAYATGWQGVVNMKGYGVDNRWSFLNMHNPGQSTIDWGFAVEPFTLNRIAAAGPSEENVFKLVYESLIGRNPYDLTVSYGWLAEPVGPGPDGVMGSAANPAAYYDDVWAETEVWYDPDGTPGTGDERITVTMRLRDGITFANGDPVTPEDVKFNSLFQRDCGSGVSFGWSTYATMEYVETQADDPSLGPRDIKWYFGMPSYWVLYYAGYTGPLNTDIWMSQAGPAGYQWPRGSGFIESSSVSGSTLYVTTKSSQPGNPCDIAVGEEVYIVTDSIDPTVNVGPYTVDVKTANVDGTFTFELSSATAPIAVVPAGSRLDEFPGDGTGWDSMDIVGYEPWLADHDMDGMVDLAEDGTGCWVFEAWDSGNTILMSRNPLWHKTQQEIRGYLIESLHQAGNVNYEGADFTSAYNARGIGIDDYITIVDMAIMARAWATDSSYPWGLDWSLYNPDADVNRDGEVYVIDWVLRLSLNWGLNYHYSPFETVYGETKVKVVAPVEPIGVGEQFNVNIAIENVEGLNTYEFTLSWNPEMLKAISVVGGGFLSEEGQIIATKIISTGYLYVGDLFLSPQTISGSGNLTAITFECIGEGTTTLELSSRLFDGGLYSMPHQDEDGEVFLNSASAQTQDLIETIEEMNLPQGAESSLTPKLDEVLRLIEKGNEVAAIDKLQTFINVCNQKREKKNGLTNEQADFLIAEAEGIIDQIQGQ